MSWLRNIVYSLFGILVLSTLWVTSLTILSDKSNSTAIITEAGASVLNPFLVQHEFGITESGYAKLKQDGKAHPTQALDLSILKVKVTEQDIDKLGYNDGVRFIYSRVAEAYYTGGPNAVFNVPTELKAFLPDFALFDINTINSLPTLPGGLSVNQLPPFLQPLFAFVGLTPQTFTADGHAAVLKLLPWFWIMTAVLGVLAVLFNHSETKLEGLFSGIVHGAWPVVAVLTVLWLLSIFLKTQFSQYVGLLGLVSKVFLPVYGTAFVIGLLGLLAAKFLPGILKNRATAASEHAEAVPVGVPAAPAPSSYQAPAYPSQPSQSDQPYQPYQQPYSGEAPTQPGPQEGWGGALQQPPSPYDPNPRG